ncbi:bifunctional diguanylate cyclase/phosphodiesterase [Roseateles koreensis]|uniref:LapD/MoxY N-terminal periplasmic domain-containing protein n=1 Tax=Roseateles koreensis TaxID=2987526 RepID=A0ABT5KYF4_9BURK|nr:LapD/MoxY N-terminal periplasmic domain-containing protein [Roseateles koreensis]MDC8786742.1 LapD/MoxY N-terminal periplasmic domain-containing protein [Roseateles koreensis]
MSLMRQIGLLVIGLVLASLLGSVAVSTASVRLLLQTELQMKNSDNAQALALVLSQQQGDPVLMDLQMSALFDTGYYQSVTLRGADGKPKVERHGPPALSHAPAWFVALTPIVVQPGVAQVSNGWNAIGSVEVSSQSAYAHDELWRCVTRIALILACVGGLAGLAAFSVLRRIRRPLDDVVAQAHAVVEGNFKVVPESEVPELRGLTQAMNAMVQRLGGMFEAQAEQLHVLRIQAHCDPLTGMSTRKHFMAELSSALGRDEGPARAGLVLLRLRDLVGLNQRLGRPAVDEILLTIAKAVKAYPDRVRGCLAGRLNGADFALWLPAPDVAGETAHALNEALRASLPAIGNGIQLALSAVDLPRHQAVGQWFGAADAALAQAESLAGFAVVVSPPVISAAESGPAGLAGPAGMAQGEQAWRAQILAALKDRRGRLVAYPVLDKAGHLAHQECPLQLQLEQGGAFEPAARWLPLAQRSRLTAEVDLLAVALALEAIAADDLPRCVNIAPASLLDGGFVARLRESVFQSPQAARKLGLELAEGAAVAHFDLLLEMGRQLRPLGVKLGLEHVGAGLAEVDRLYQAGLDYVKLDVAVVSGVSGDAARAAFVRGMVVMLRSLALKVYAEGVSDAMDVQALWDCELDGVTGPWATGRAAAR